MQWITCDSTLAMETSGHTNSETLQPILSFLSSTVQSQVLIASLFLIIVVSHSSVILWWQSRDNAIRNESLRIGGVWYCEVISPIGSKNWSAHVGTGIEGHTWTWRSAFQSIYTDMYKSSAMQSLGLSGPTFFGVLYIHPDFIHVLECCPRNVYNLTCTIWHPCCPQHSSASKSHPIPAQSPLCS